MTQPPHQPEQWPPSGPPQGNPAQWPAGWPTPQQNGPAVQPPAAPAPFGGQPPYTGAPQHSHPGQPYPGQPHSGPQEQPYARQATPEMAQQHQNPSYGGGFQPSAYGGLGAFSAEAVKGAPKPKRPWVIGGAVVVLLVIAGGAGWLLGAFRGDTLDQKSLEDGVARVLADNYGEPGATNVSCPAGESTVNGTTFDCTLRLAGQAKKVTVRVLNDKPEYSVGAPH